MSVQTYVSRTTDNNKTAFYRSHRLVQQRLREMKEAWTARKAVEIQGYVGRNEWKNFVAIKAVYSPTAKSTAPLLNADGTTLPSEKM
ncbi:hypothetical protein SprV_0200773400 [Sparganum proliferum]